MLDSLTNRLQGVFSKLSSKGTVRENDLDEAMREVRVALLEADVNFKVVREFINNVRERAKGADVLKSLTGPQQVIGFVNDEMVRILGEEQAGLETASKPPTIHMLIGPKGSGKTTTAAKLALNLRKSGQKALLICADNVRVAGSEQLKALGKQLNVPVADLSDVKQNALAKAALAEAKKHGATVLIVDTTGQITFDDESTADLQAIHKAFRPTETLLVIDAMTGQEAVNVAQEIDDVLGITGFIMAKMDGDARGGAALSIRAVTGVPIKFVGTGEKADALEAFHPDRFASRILGMGDVLTLIEKAKAELTDEDVESLSERMKKGTLTLEDFLAQYQRVRRMGPFSQLVGLLPGLSQIKGRLNVEEMDEKFFDQVEAIIFSMTVEERRHSNIIDGSRRRRIAQGSGTTPADVNRVLKQYKEAKRIMQQITSGQDSKILSMLG